MDGENTYRLSCMFLRKVLLPNFRIVVNLSGRIRSWAKQGQDSSVNQENNVKGKPTSEYNFNKY